MSEKVDPGLTQSLAHLVLATQRRRLAAYLRRLALSDAADASPKVANGIAETRAKIARVKAILHANGGEVTDHPNDT